jgi:hypothetical protein
MGPMGRGNEGGGGTRTSQHPKVSGPSERAKLWNQEEPRKTRLKVKAHRIASSADRMLLSAAFMHIIHKFTSHKNHRGSGSPYRCHRKLERQAAMGYCLSGNSYMKSLSIHPLEQGDTKGIRDEGYCLMTKPRTPEKSPATHKLLGKSVRPVILRASSNSSPT